MSSDSKRLRHLVNEELLKLFEYRPNTFMLSHMEEQDQDGDGDEDFDDVRVARYVAGGMKKDKALGKVKQKPMGQKGRKDEIAAETGSLAESIQRMTLRERKMLHESIKRRILKESDEVKESIDIVDGKYKWKVYANGRLFMTKSPENRKVSESAPVEIKDVEKKQEILQKLKNEHQVEFNELKAKSEDKNQSATDRFNEIVIGGENGSSWRIIFDKVEESFVLEIEENIKQKRDPSGGYYKWRWFTKQQQLQMVGNPDSSDLKDTKFLQGDDLVKTLRALIKKYPNAFDTLGIYNKNASIKNGKITNIDLLGSVAKTAADSREGEKELASLKRARLDDMLDFEIDDTPLAKTTAADAEDSSSPIEPPPRAPEEETDRDPVGTVITKDGKEIYRKMQAGWMATLRATADQILSIVKPENRAQFEKILKGANQGDKINLQPYILINPDLETTFTKDGDGFVDPKIVPISVINQIKSNTAAFAIKKPSAAKPEQGEMPDIETSRFAVGDAIIDIDEADKTITVRVPDDRTGRFTGFESLFGSGSDISGKIQAAAGTKKPNQIKLKLGLATQDSVMAKFSGSILRGLGIGAVTFKKEGNMWVATMPGGQRTKNLSALMKDLKDSGQAKPIYV